MNSIQTELQGFPAQTTFSEGLSNSKSELWFSFESFICSFGL